MKSIIAEMLNRYQAEGLIDKNAMEELDISNLECEIIDSEKYERIVNH